MRTQLGRSQTIWVDSDGQLPGSFVRDSPHHSFRASDAPLVGE